MSIEPDRVVLESYKSPTREFGYKVVFFKGTEQVQEVKYCANRMDDHFALEIHKSIAYYRNAFRCKVTRIEAPEVFGIEDVNVKGINNAHARLYAKAEGLVNDHRHTITVENRVSNPPRFN